MERFQSIETVFQAKSELPQALPPDGIAILNGDDPHCRRMAENTSAQVFFYGSDPTKGELHCTLKSTNITTEGMQCLFEYQEKEHKATIPVFGRHQAMNAAGAFLTAVQLGVPPIVAIAALQTLPQIPHRLVVQRGNDGVITIDDAYNSNPEGFQSALEILREMPGNRKILVTPGMVELGERHDEEHYKIGAIAARSCDVVCHIAPHRSPTFRKGLFENGFNSENYYQFPTLHEAREWLNKELKEGDVLLFENDLPDLLEQKKAFSLY